MVRSTLKEFWEGFKDGFMGAWNMGAPILKVVVLIVCFLLIALTSYALWGV